MERGHEGRPAHDTDETIEAIELVGAPADGDAIDEPIEDGASTEGPSPRHVPGEGPPAHWLAYIRARAPWLLSAGGLLGETVSGSVPDGVPHGPAADLAAWPPVGPVASAGGATSPATPTFGVAPTRRLVREATPGNLEPSAGRRGGDDEAPRWGVPDVAAQGHAPADRPPAIDDPGGRTEDVDDRLRAVAEEAPAVPGSMEPLGLDAEPESPTHARQPAAWAVDPGDAGQARTPASLAPIPSLQPVDPAPPPAWPALPPPDNGTQRVHPGDAWPPPVARAQRTVAPMPGPDRPTTARARADFEPLPAPTRPDASPRDRGGWQVRAAAPDTSVVARLALPPWPDLPELPPDEDDPDWRAIERRLQRAARLDREQRRR